MFVHHMSPLYSTLHLNRLTTYLHNKEKGRIVPYPVTSAHASKIVKLKRKSENELYHHDVH